ncbi:hypothetical protein PDQ34_26015 [Bacillus cereus]|nr:hypothetical protein [Bacillus cereus]MDA2572666.1 hypothetical protein [Bacillus cereus]
MRRIQLTDGIPLSVRREDLKSRTVDLLLKVKEECSKSGLSYVEVNKALHVADEELYRRVIRNSCQS